MDVLIERCAGLDVHRDSVMATVRLPGKGRRQREQHTCRVLVLTAPVSAVMPSVDARKPCSGADRAAIASPVYDRRQPEVHLGLLCTDAPEVRARYCERERVGRAG